MNVSNINVGVEHGNEKFRKDMLNRAMPNEGNYFDALKILDRGKFTSYS